VSFGIFELTADRPMPDPGEVLGPLRDFGYDGVDLGPVGFLGRGDELKKRLRDYDLALCGGWVDLPFTADDATFAAALPVLDDALSVFVTAAEVFPDRPPLPTLADSGDDVRRAHPGGRTDIEPSPEGWDRLARNVATAAERIRAAGLEPTFHHHVGTNVETVSEVETFLDRTDVDLTFDTGHLLLGGGDPVAHWRQWRDRINHVHVKDADLSVLRQAIDEGAGMHAVWKRGGWVRLGGGDLDLAGFMDAIVADGYDGWVVIEHDVMPSPDHSFDEIVEDQRANREALRRWL
jgi:inosose dehydratase